MSPELEEAWMNLSPWRKSRRPHLLPPRRELPLRQRRHRRQIHLRPPMPHLPQRLPHGPKRLPSIPRRPR